MEALRWRADPEAHALHHRREPAVHQRLAHDARGVEVVRRRAGGSARPARSPVASLAGAAARLARCVRACATTALAEYQKHYRSCRSLVAEHAALSTAESAREQELDLLRHQVNEIKAAKLDAAEEEEIESRYKLASNSKRLIELAERASSRGLSEADDAVLSQLAETQRLLRELEKDRSGGRGVLHQPRRRSGRADRRSRARSATTSNGSISTRSNSPRSSNASRSSKP